VQETRKAMKEDQVELVWILKEGPVDCRWRSFVCTSCLSCSQMGIQINS
jgi:hypothetical protein